MNTLVIILICLIIAFLLFACKKEGECWPFFHIYDPWEIDGDVYHRKCRRCHKVKTKTIIRNGKFPRI